VTDFWSQFVPRFEGKPRIELRDNPRVKKWVQVLLDHRENLENAAGGELGAVLGCGHWGCVVDMADPWVLKLTIDPTEAHVWARITELEADEVYGQDGFTRLKRIFELKPGIRYGGRMKRVYGIVREKIAPAFWDKGVTAYTLQRLGMEWPHAQPPTFSHRTLLGLDVSSHPRAAWVKGNVEEFSNAVQGLLDYRYIAQQWYQRLHVSRREEMREQLQRVINNKFGGPIGGPLGESLGMLLDNDLVLRDTHLGNVGWRVFEEVDGEEAPDSLVIFDPGHTPTDKRELPVEEWQQFAALG
jgi:hypothetical protein